MRISLAAVSVCLGFGACLPFTSGCDADLLVRMSPADTSIRVGEQFHVGVTLRGCGGQRPLSDAISWASEDSTIARVDATTGMVTGLRVGATVIRGTGAIYGDVAASRVSVHP